MPNALDVTSSMATHPIETHSPLLDEHSSILPLSSSQSHQLSHSEPHLSTSLTTTSSHSAHVPSLHWASSEQALTHQHRMISAAAGSLLTSLTMTPFDVVKTRLQAQINARPTGNTVASVVTAGVPNVTDSRMTYTHVFFEDSYHSNLSRPRGELRFNGAIDAAAKLVKYEGITSLWRGLSPTIVMAVPATICYFSLYDHIKFTLARTTPHHLEQYMHSENAHKYSSYLQTMAPMISGVCARAFTTTLVSPIELIRTKSQASQGTSSPSMRSLFMSEIRSGGVLSLWRGVGPTLMRDVPFSAIYWTCYEYTKSYFLERWHVDNDAASNSHKSAWIYASFLAGAGSGMISATVTHPFDLIKTRRQIDLYRSNAQSKTNQTSSSTSVPNHSQRLSLTTSSTRLVLPSSTIDIFRRVIAEEGYIGLLSGLSARLTKIAPACAIMISTYEASKMILGERDQQQRAAESKQKYRQ